MWLNFRFGLWEGDLLDWRRVIVGLSHGIWLWSIVISWLRRVVVHGFGLWSVVRSWLWLMVMVMIVVLVVLLVLVMLVDWLRL